MKPTWSRSRWRSRWCPTPHLLTTPRSRTVRRAGARHRSRRDALREVPGHPRSLLRV